MYTCIAQHRYGLVRDQNNLRFNAEYYDVAAVADFPVRHWAEKRRHGIDRLVEAVRMTRIVSSGQMEGTQAQASPACLWDRNR